MAVLLWNKLYIYLTYAGPLHISRHLQMNANMFKDTFMKPAGLVFGECDILLIMSSFAVASGQYLFTEHKMPHVFRISIQETIVSIVKFQQICVSKQSDVLKAFLVSQKGQF